MGEPTNLLELMTEAYYRHTKREKRIADLYRIDCRKSENYEWWRHHFPDLPIEKDKVYIWNRGQGFLQTIEADPLLVFKGDAEFVEKMLNYNFKKEFLGEWRPSSQTSG